MGNSTDRLTVKMGLKLSQIIGVDMKRQILITNVWLEQVTSYVLRSQSDSECFGCPTGMFVLNVLTFFNHYRNGSIIN